MSKSHDRVNPPPDPWPGSHVEMSDPRPRGKFRRPLLTVAESAEILNVSPRTVRRLIKNQKLPVVRVGRSVRVRPEDIEKLIGDE